MPVVFYYKCENCNTVFAVDPQNEVNRINLAPGFEEILFSGESTLPLGDNVNRLHACDNHTFGPAKFIYGKKTIAPEEI